MLAEKLQHDLIEAMKSKNEAKLTTVRYIVAQVKNKEIDKRQSLTDEEVMGVLKKIATDLKESIAAFEKGNRADLVAEYQAQLAIVASYLPEEISDEELKKEVEKLVAQNKTLFEQNPKALIGISVKKLKDKASTDRIIKTLNALSS